MPMTQLLKRLWPEEDGENLSEYGLLLLLMSLLAVAGMRGLASSVDHAYAKASTQVITSGGSMESITTDPSGDVYTNQFNLAAVPQPDAPAVTGHVNAGLKSQVENSPR